MRVNLDNCCYNRPFDPQDQLRVAIETSAKIRVQALMRSGQVEYVWSAVLDYEVGKSPYLDRIDMIWPWSDHATVFVPMTASIVDRGAAIQTFGVKRLDALHLASAESVGCDWFLTTDKGILKKLRNLGQMRIANPVDFGMEDDL